MVAPLVSEVSIPEPEVEIDALAKHELTSTAEGSPAEPETCAIEETPAGLDQAETRNSDDENVVNPSETIEPSATEAEHMFSLVEDKINVADDKSSDSALTFSAAQQLPEVTSEEIVQPQTTSALLLTEDVLENEENQGEIITSSAQETGVDVVSSSKNALSAVEVETEVESEAHGTDADTTTNDLAAKIIPEIEQPVMPTTDVFIFYSCENALADLFYLERATLPDM